MCARGAKWPIIVLVGVNPGQQIEEPGRALTDARYSDWKERHRVQCRRLEAATDEH